jgi:hypothetical protein
VDDDTESFQCVQCLQWVSGSEAAELRDITEGELEEIRRSLAELG